MSDKLVEIAEDSARGGFFLFTGKTLSTFILAVGSIVVSRLLGPENYGLYGLSLVAPSIFLLFTDYGVNVAVTRFSAKLRSEGKPQLVAGMLKSAVLFKLLAGIVMFTVCFTLSDSFAIHVVNRPEIAPLIRLTAFLVLFQTALTTADSAFRGLDRMQDNALTLNVQSVVKATSSPLLVLLGFGVVGAVVGHVLGYVAAGTASLLILFLKHYKHLGGAPKNPDRNSFSSNLKLMMGYGLPLYVSSLLFSFRGQYQTIILAHFTSNADIGNLGVAMNFASLITILTFPVTVLFPAFSKLNPKSEEAKRLFTHSVKYTSLIIIPAATAAAVLSNDLVIFIYGPSYNLAPLLLSIYTLNFLYAGIGSLVLGYLLTGAGETRLILKANLINLFIFTLSAPVLTWLYGVPGIIAALLISALLSLVYQLLKAKKKFKVNFNLKDSARIYLSSIISTVPTFLFLHLSPFQNLTNIILSGALYLLTYLTLTPLLGAVRAQDIENLKHIFSKIKVVWPFLKFVLAYEAKLVSTVKR